MAQKEPTKTKLKTKREREKSQNAKRRAKLHLSVDGQNISGEFYGDLALLHPLYDYFDFK
jgi:hypothetical protein